MKWMEAHSALLAGFIYTECEKEQTVSLKQPKASVVQGIVSWIEKDFEKEKQLEEEVYQMLDELEKTHQGQFERHKMYPLLKKQLAQKKGIVL